MQYDDGYSIDEIAVDVAALFHTNGKVEPYAFWWEDGTEYSVDRILECERAASLKAGIIIIDIKSVCWGRKLCTARSLEGE